MQTPVFLQGPTHWGFLGKPGPSDGCQAGCLSLRPSCIYLLGLYVHLYFQFTEDKREIQTGEVSCSEVEWQAGERASISFFNSKQNRVIEIDSLTVKFTPSKCTFQEFVVLPPTALIPEYSITPRHTHPHPSPSPWQPQIHLLWLGFPFRTLPMHRILQRVSPRGSDGESQDHTGWLIQRRAFITRLSHSYWQKNPLTTPRFSMAGTRPRRGLLQFSNWNSQGENSLAHWGRCALPARGCGPGQGGEATPPLPGLRGPCGVG